jgi:hypothetical protein
MRYPDFIPVPFDILPEIFAKFYSTPKSVYPLDATSTHLPKYAAIYKVRTFPMGPDLMSLNAELEPVPPYTDEDSPLAYLFNRALL